MIVSRGLPDARKRAKTPSIVSIGVFDGVHLGHRAILQANTSAARERGATPTVVTFAGHPKRVLLGRAPRTLTTLEHRLNLFRELGVEHTLVLQFDETLRETSATDFLHHILLDGLAAEHFVLGFDSKFGRDQQGHAEFLRLAGQTVQVVDRVSVRGRAISSSAIREAVGLGDIVAASAMLGRRVSVMGTVERGDALGRTLGFPTANLNLHHELHPPAGVYAGFARVLGPFEGEPDPPLRQPHLAMANIGVRPSLSHQGPPEERVEVHLIDYSGPEIYGATVEFEFASRLREEEAFPDLDALRRQLERDRDASLAALAGCSPDFGAHYADSGPGG